MENENLSLLTNSFCPLLKEGWTLQNLTLLGGWKKFV